MKLRMPEMPPGTLLAALGSYNLLPAIILTPPRIRMLLLSATIGNADEFAAWIAEVRGVHCGVVTRPGARPVPLRAAFMMPDKRLVPLLNEKGNLNSEILQLTQRGDHERHRRRSRGG